MSFKSIVEAYNELTPLDLRILRVIEVGHRKYEYVPYEVIVNWSKKPEEIVGKSLKRLNALGLVIRQKGSYTGYRLTFAGYDILALHTLAKRGIIERVSPTPIGVGKESDVYTADAVGGEKVIIKFHRLGRTSFRQIRRVRSFVGDRRHITWLYESRLSAHAEFKALVLAYNAGVSVPKPIAVNRHAVVAEYVNGVQLSEIDELDDPEGCFWDIIENVRKLVADVGVIHGDLSEYNVLIRLEDGKPFIIDWPQWIPKNAPNAPEILKRDITNIVKFFEKKFRLKADPNEIFDYVTSGVEFKLISLEEAFEQLLGKEGLAEVISAPELEEKSLEFE